MLLRELLVVIMLLVSSRLQVYFPKSIHGLVNVSKLKKER